MAASVGFGSARCRFCGAALSHTFVDLGMSPLCESYVSADQLNQMEPFYPLHVYVCGECFLVQLEEYVSPKEIFSHYAYFSSYSDSWLDHAKRYAEMAVRRFELGPQSLVIEIASNDGYLLQYFVAKGIPVMGIEPASNVVEAAQQRKVPTRVEFFGKSVADSLAKEGKRASLLIGNNVLAQVPDLNDFVGAMRIVLAPRGVSTMEFPSLLSLMEQNQFDTIYHEHFSYFSFFTVDQIFQKHGLRIFDVEEIPTHGGSLRIYACHAEEPWSASKAVEELREKELLAGINRLETYCTFGERVKQIKRKLLEFLIVAKEAGKSVAGYGAPGKGNTLLNYCGVRTDFLEYTVDRNPFKQGKFLPGTHIPVFAPERIRETRPDYLLILPWNLKDEIIGQNSFIREWGGQFVVPIPTLEIIE
jgi:SAM-dependent methyltransferase